MKNTFKYLFAFFSGMAMVFVFNRVSAQDKELQEITQEFLDAKNFVFVAQSVSPLRGRTRFLTTYYDVKIGPDTVSADLPYFGRAYAPPVDLTEGGIRFTSTDFEYTVKKRKRKGWEITIKPKGQTGVQQLFFNIYENGNAYLQVTSTNRQPISFNGKITIKPVPGS